MRASIAGARRTGASVASTVRQSRLSARPWARRASVAALAGAMTTASARRPSSTWEIARSARRGEDVGVDGPAAQPLERDRRDEAGARLREDDVDLRARLRQLADQVGSLVGGDAAGYADDDPLAFEHGSTLLVVTVCLLNEAQSDEREVNVHVLDDFRFAGDEGRQSRLSRLPWRRRPAPSSCGRRSPLSAPRSRR